MNKNQISSLLLRYLVNPKVLSGVALLFLAPSCNIIGLRGHMETLETLGSITIHVSPPPKGNSPTFAVAWRMENGVRKDSAGFQEVGPDGLASFNLRMDNIYSVGAFTDENGNRCYDAGEPLGYLKGIKPHALTETTSKPEILQIKLKRDHGFPEGTVIQVPMENRELGGKVDLSAGDVVSLDDKRFEAEDGSSGLWRPLHFLGENTTGIFFTEPYDPKRIPVLFVYGIGGSPQDWRYFIDHFDRKNYQVWFCNYPSGMRLERDAHMVATSLGLLKERYKFPQCYVVAHSMGGLVSRASIAMAAANSKTDFIPKFVTISTPWGGHKAAEGGVRHLKKPVPSWIDMVPNSAFLINTYATPLPHGTAHHLIYGSIDGKSMWMKDANDGVVTVESETDPRIKKDAVSVHYLPYGHVAILNQPETLHMVEEELGR